MFDTSLQLAKIRQDELLAQARTARIGRHHHSGARSGRIGLPRVLDPRRVRRTSH